MKKLFSFLCLLVLGMSMSAWAYVWSWNYDDSKTFKLTRIGNTNTFSVDFQYQTSSRPSLSLASLTLTNFPSINGTYSFTGTSLENDKIEADGLTCYKPAGSITFTKSGDKYQITINVPTSYDSYDRVQDDVTITGSCTVTVLAYTSDGTTPITLTDEGSSSSGGGEEEEEDDEEDDDGTLFDFDFHFNSSTSTIYSGWDETYLYYMEANNPNAESRCTDVYFEMVGKKGTDTRSYSDFDVAPVPGTYSFANSTNPQCDGAWTYDRNTVLLYTSKTIQCSCYDSYWGYYYNCSSTITTDNYTTFIYDGDTYRAFSSGQVVVEEGVNGNLYLVATYVVNNNAKNTVRITIGEPKPKYRVSVSSNNESLGTVGSAGAKYKEGTNSDTFTATEIVAGTFEGWYLDGTKVTGTTSEYTVTNDGKSIQLLNLQAKHTLEAKFIAIGGSYPINYGVSPAGAGTFTQATYGGTPGTTFSSGTSISGGESVTLAVEATSGYRFDKWNDNVSTTSRTFTVSKEENLVAQFIKTYTISTACEDETGNTTNNGSISGGGTKDDGASCTLTASSTEPLNYYFKEWKDNNSTNASRTFTVNSTTSATTYTAVFAAREVVNITANGAQTRDDDNWYVEGVSESGYTVHLYFDSNNELNTTNSWIEKDGNRVTAQSISVATVSTTAASATLHVEAIVILNNDTKKYVIVGDYDKDLTPLWGDFKFGRDNITLDNFQYDWWEPVSSVRFYAIKGIKSGTTDNYVWLCFKLSATSTYNGQVGPQSGRTYPVVTPVEDGFWANPNGGNYWLWRFQNGESDAMVGWGDKVTYSMNNSYYDYPCYVSSYFGDYEDDENITAKEPFDGKSAIVDKGKDGNIYVQIVDNDGNRYVTIGEPAQPYDLAWDANGKSLTGGTPEGSVIEGTSITAPTSNTPGYTVSSWSPAFTGTMPSANTTYTAQWNIVNYTITYNGLEGATNSNPTSYNVETATIVLADPGTRDGYVFAGWKDESDNTITQIAKGSTGNRTLTATWNVKSSNIELCEDCNNAHYNTFKANYNNEKVNVTYNRQFTVGRWSTMCLPFNVNYATMKTFGMDGCVYEFKYATGNANVGSGVNLYFSNAKSIEAGKCYIVNADETLSEKKSFVFSNVTVDVSKDLGEALNSKEAYDNLSNANGYKTKGDIELVGTLRNGTLKGVSKDSQEGNTYMGLKENKIYYPNISQGSMIWAYRGIFHSSKALDIKNMQKMRIIVDGEDRGEIRVEDGEIIDADGDVRALSDDLRRKFIRDGVLYIERNGVNYDAQGKRVDSL